ncbi:MAG TPA: M91 family zinc metallopeptidase [Candidatus Binatia bacterium]|nr:M91 family zinc metallopeptidase [Candidatus Binatia bacterium]
MVLWLAPSLAWTDAIAYSADRSPPYANIVERDYSRISRYRIPYGGIKLQGSSRHVGRLSGWLDQIFAVPHGRVTVEAILASGTKLTIRSSEWALPTSGRTLAPVTLGLINGRGADVEILFDARIPDQGSHWVYGQGNHLIEFTAIQNLYHELAHAKHLTNGTWRYANSEAQAIEEENVFRGQLSKQQGHRYVSYGVSIGGVQIWRPGTSKEWAAFTD